MTRPILSAIAVLVLSGLAGAPQALRRGQQPAQQVPPIFRAGTNIVRVDVAVTDGSANPVTNLTVDDFEIREDGILQTVSSFQLVTATGQADRPGDGSLAIRSREHAAAEIARDDVRVFLIFWDEYHIDRMPGANKARESLTRFVTTAFGPTDLLALMDPLTPIDAIEFTRDRAALTRRIQKLEGRLGIFLPPRSPVEEAHLQFMADAVRLRSEVTLSAIQAAAVHLGTLRESRKSIIVVSEGFDGLGQDWPRWVREVSQAANAANTAIYTVDPRGLGQRMWPSDQLIELAINTGGEAFVNVNYPERLMRRAVTAQSAYYLLGYQSSQNPSDGKFHEIDARVKRRGLTVRARRGYWAPGAVEVERAREAAVAAEAPPAVLEALSVLSPSRGSRSVDVWLGTARGEAGLTDVTIAWAPRRGAGRPKVTPASVKVTARDATDRVVFEGPAQGRQLSFSAAPGKLTIRADALDETGGVIDSETREAAIPAYAAGALAVSTPVVLRAQTPVEFRELGVAPDPAPYPGREFSRTDRLLVRFAVYGDMDATGPAIRLLSQRGRVLTSLGVAPIEGRQGMYQIDLPLSFAAPGEYLISITVQRGEERAEALVAVRVTS
jgi:VWFA-related protein